MWLVDLFLKHLPQAKPERTWRLSMDAFAVPTVIGTVTESMRLVTYPYTYTHEDNSTREFYWRHPEGFPFQVYGGPHNPGPDHARQVWTNLPHLEGYKLLVDDYTDRVYHYWLGA